MSVIFDVVPALASGAMATGLAAGGTLLEAGMGVAQANQQANILEANAEIAKREGELNREAAKGEAQKLSRERSRMVGNQTTLFGASGVDPSAGSPLDVMAQTASEYERDIQLSGYKGDLAMNSAMGESEIYKYGARGRRRAGWINAGGTLLTGAGRSLLGRY